MKDVLFLAGRRLPDEDKIRLIDLVPGIGNYVKKLIVNTEQDEAGIGVGDLLKRLPNLRRVVTKTPILYEDMAYKNGYQPSVTEKPTGAAKYGRQRRVLIKLAETNPRITEFEGFCDEAILEYMLRVKELDQNYDAGNVKQVYVSRFDYLTPFFEKFPDVKLKLSDCLWRYQHEDELVQNGRGHLIHDLELEEGYSLLYEFKSVRILTVLSGIKFSKNLSLVPNVEDVRIDAPIRAEDANMIQSLLVIKNLRSLKLFSHVEWSEANFNAFQSILWMPSLKHLEFGEKLDSELKLINAFLDCERNDFKSLTIRIPIKLKHKTINWWSVSVRDDTITIYKPIDFSLVRLFRKFKRIKQIAILTRDEKFVERIRNEIDLIVKSLPRNRSLCVFICGRLARY